MGKIRIYELAKELHQDSKTIIGQLKQMNVNVENIKILNNHFVKNVRKTY